MSRVTSSSIAEAPEPAEPVPPRAGRAGRRRRGRGALVVIVVLALVAAGVAIAIARPFGAARSSGNSLDNGARTSLATVTRRSLTSQVNVSATLGYSGTYSVVNQAVGTITSVPAVGRVIKQGGVLYRVDGSAVVLLYGSIPAYRSLFEGMTGADVRQLNADLVALGDATRSELDPASDSFGHATLIALEKLQANVGVGRTGFLAQGQAVFLPTAARITAQAVTPGSPAQPGTPVLSASSTIRQVVIQLDAAQRSEVKVGDHVLITLPDNRTTPGVVSSVGTVATTPASSDQNGPGSGSSTPTVEIDVRPLHPAATGHLDQAPVLVAITTASVEDVLVVPVTALLALAGGGYALEVASAGGHHLVPVQLGLFDDADGLVQVTGTNLSAGQRVVVPSL